MKLKNQVMLITYGDSLGSDIAAVHRNLNQYFQAAIGNVHLLPYFPSTGDRGFAPSDYRQVDPQLGDWSAVTALAADYPLMSDFMINHLSRQSPQFQDFQQKGAASAYRDLFLRWDRFWPVGRPTEADVALIYKRKDRAPEQTITFQDGSTAAIWNTFGPEQLDLDVRPPVTKDFIRTTLTGLIQRGSGMIRLDAFAYAIKKLDSNDFFVEPEIWTLLAEVAAIAREQGAELLPEIHEHYSIQRKLTDHGYWTYDFALPMVVLHALYSGTTTRLAAWLAASPMRQFTTLDTHDGIGVVDVRDILTPAEIDFTVAELYKVGANVKRKYSSAAYHNLDIYQLNTTFYSALGDDDRRYFLSRLLQMFAPGIPQVYYVGLLAGKNDLALLEATKEGRNINRHYYTDAEIATEVQRPVVQALLALFAFRNQSAAFDLAGTITVTTPTPQIIVITRENQAGTVQAQLTADLQRLTYQVTENGQAVTF